MAILVRILVFLSIAYIVLIIFLFLGQSRMVYFPYKAIVNTPADAGLAYKEVMFKTAGGVRLCGWMVGDLEPDKPVLLFCHGNAGNISHRLDSFEIFNYLGLTTFIFDYRGYGKSEGKPSEQGTYLDAAAAWQYLTGTEHIPPGRIILFGCQGVDPGIYVHIYPGCRRTNLPVTAGALAFPIQLQHP
jgi:hypothetical protein